MRAFRLMRTHAPRTDSLRLPASGRRLTSLAGLLALLLVASLLPVACDTDNPPLLGLGGGGGGGNGSQDSLISAFTVQSGDLQNGSTLETFGQPLQVLATDDLGFGVPGVAVGWEVKSGVATVSATSGITDSTGVAEILVTAGPVLGPIVVQANAAGSSLYRAEFVLLVTAVQVEILADRFVGPLGGDTVDVVAGDTVEWLNRDLQSHLLRSVVLPEGGTTIRSDSLRNSDRYRFVPNVAGIWVYEDELSSSVPAPRGVIRAVGRQEVGSLSVELVLSAGNPPPRAVLATVDGGLYAAAMAPGDTVVFLNLSAVPHIVRLRDVPLNCVVAGDNPRSVPVVASDTVRTRFQLGCQ